MKWSARRQWKLWGAAACAVLFFAYAAWATTHFVLAFNEEKRVHIFPAAVAANGFDNKDNALSQDLPDHAPYASFSTQNSASVAIDTPAPVSAVPVSVQQTSVPENLPVQSVSLDTSASSTTTASATSSDTSTLSPVATSTEATSTQVQSPPPDLPAQLDTATSTSVDQDLPQPNLVSVSAVDASSSAATSSDAIPIPVATSSEATPAEENASTSVATDTPQSVRARTQPFSFARIEALAAQIAASVTTKAYALEDASTSAFDATGTLDTTDASSSATSTTITGDLSGASDTAVQDTPVCSVLGIECHTISFSGFGVTGSLTQKNFKRAELNFSLGSLSQADIAQKGKLEVRYYHAGKWHDAGEIFLNNEVSNETNGAYFTANLDAITDWSDLSDVQVVIEYVRSGAQPPVRLYLDALWIDGVYTEPAQDVLAGPTAQTIPDLPVNVRTDLSGQNQGPNLLVEDDGTQISFPYLMELSSALTLRADKPNYPSPGAQTPQSVYVSVTNTGSSPDSFHFFGSFPKGQGTLASIEEYERNVPVATSSSVAQDVTYFCDGGWQVGTSSGATSQGSYSCSATGDTHTCDSLGDSGASCLVRSESVPLATSTAYTSAWVQIPVTTTPQNYGAVLGSLPHGYQVAAGSDPAIAILPGQTLYFRFSIATPDTGLAKFVISASGNGFGTLDSLRLQNETSLTNKHQKAQQTLLKTQLNDQLSTSTDFDVNQMPVFHFKWKTQRSFFTQLKDFLTGTGDTYRIADAQLVHASGEHEHVPVDITYSADDKWSLALEKAPRDFRPGKYTLELTITEGGQTYQDSVEFYWGVLAQNPDQATYAPGQTAHIAISALDDQGDTMCGANLDLTVTTPSGDTVDVPVVSGGGCGHNNVTTLPDYEADYQPAENGTYTLTLERLDESGAIVNTSVDSFTVDDSAPYYVTRTGPTRVYPPSAYTMQLAVDAKQSFTGTIEEAVPEGFTIADAGGATIRRANGAIYLDWDVSMQSGDQKTLSYAFKVPQVSPYMYLVGPLSFLQDGTSTYTESRSWKIAADALPIATGIAWLSGNQLSTGATELNSGTPTALSWNLSADYDSTYFSYSSSTPSQLAIQTDGDYLVSLTLPVNRTDASTRSSRVEADVYVNGAQVAYGVARSAYISNRSSQQDSSDHMNVLLPNLHAGDYVEVYEYSPDTVNAADHMVITGAASLYAEYIDNSQTVYAAVGTTTSAGTNLNPAATSTMYWYDDSTGRKDSGYTHSNSSSPGNITLPASGYYLVDVNIPLSGAITDGSVRGRVLLNGAMLPGGDFKQGFIANLNGDAVSSIHWSGVVQATTTSENLSVTVQQEGASGTLTIGTNEASIYVQELPGSGIIETRTRNLTGGTNWNVSPKQAASWTTEDVKDTGNFTHSTVTNPQNITVSKAGDYLLVFNDTRDAAISRANQIDTVEVNGTAITGAVTKTHYISDLGGQTESSGALTFLLRNLSANDVVTVSSLQSATAGTVPEDQDAVLMLWYKAAQSSFIQDTERWYANANSATTTDPWPSGAIDLNEGDAITSGTPVKSADVLRVRVALQATTNTVAGADSFKLQYAAGSTCSPALAWTDVGAIGSGSIWRGYDNAGVAAGTTISSTDLQLSVSSTTETYEEQNPSASTPHGISAGKDGEWDWTLQDNGAPAGTDYCFRMVSSSGQVLKDYNDYPQLETDSQPDAPTLAAPFDNAKLASTTPWFDFSSTDPNGEDIHYEVQISTDPNFGSTVVDENSITQFSDFQNLDTPADKSPFNSGENIRFIPSATLTNGTTYWWRVRAKDPSGTNSWGSYSAAQSFTLDTSVTVSTWFQTTQAQFNEDTLQNLVTTATDTVDLATGQTSGMIFSPEIDYSEKTSGNSWGTLTWNDVHTSGTILYHVEYLDSTSTWELVPDSDLPGNAAGTSTKPINLTALDTGTYSSIRVRADFTKTTGTPVLTDWTLSWALSVAAPTQTKLFDNEKTATTTPDFQFTTTDPQGDTLTYQIQWSTDATFATGVTTRTSGTDAGFTDVASSTASNPFPSGDTIDFHVQNADRLASSTTYWWRVRAKDPGGGNAYSLWSNERSFTTDTTVQQSTWFQTTTEQFATDNLDRSTASAGGVSATTDDGKIAIYRAATAGESITTATFTHGWDTTVRQDNVYSLSGTTSILLKAGHYAVFYGSRFDSTAGTRRSVIQTDLSLASTSQAIGWSQGFMPRVNGANAAFTSGGGIIYASADNTKLQLQSFRTDANTTATLVRTANTAGIELIKLDDNWDYIRLSKTGLQTGPTSAAWTTVTYNSEDEVDTGSFSHVQGSGNIVLNNPGHYLVFANTYGSLPTGNTNETQVIQRLTLDGSDINGSYTTVYMRGNSNSNAIYEGAASIGMIIQSTTTNQVLNVQVSRALGTASWTIDANAAGTYVNRTAITVVKLPEGDFLRLQDTGTQNINPSTLTALTWNTEVEKDIASWTHSTVTNASRMQANIAGDYLFLGTLYSAPAGVTDGDFNQGWRKNGGTLLQYGQTGGISVNTTTSDDGNWSGIIFPSMVNGDYAELVSQAVGAAGTMPAVKKGIEALRIGSLTEADPQTPTVESTDIVFTNGAGPKWSNVSWSATAPGSSSFTMQVEYASSTSATGYALVPDSDLPGNSSGTTTSPINIANLNHTTYGDLRLLGTLHCSAGNCPTLNDWTVQWSQGINISGTIKQFDQTTNVTSGTVAVAVNGVLQAGKTGTISGGSWTISNVTAFTGDVITVFVQGATTSTRAVGITKYETTGDITGMKLYQGHLTLGSNDNPLLTNTDIGSYDNSVSGSSDLFFDTNAGGDLSVCATGVSGCSTYRLLVLSGTVFEPAPSGTHSVTTPYLEIDGTLIADGTTINVSKSWRNKGAFIKGASMVVFTATSTTESIDSTGATSTAFSAVTFGQSSGAATWNLITPLSASGTVAISYGTLAQGSTSTITLEGDLTIGANGVFAKSTATTTFSGSGTNTWTDNSAAKQDLGTVVVDGATKTIQLGSNVKATSITIGSDDTLSANGGNTITVLGTWTNNNVFNAGTGTVVFAATTTGNTIAPGGSSFYNLSFNGAGGNWAFSASAISVTNDFTISAGTVTLPTGTTTVAGNFDGSGGSFLHNNGVIAFTASSAKSIHAGSSAFYDLNFNGSGSWSFVDTSATSSRNVTISSGTVTLPSGTFAIGGSLSNAGAITSGSGTLRFFATSAQTIKFGGSTAGNLTLDGVGGSWTFLDQNATTTGNFTITNGSTTLPSVSLEIQGSFTNSGTFNSNGGLVRFSATTTGKTINPGTSTFYDLQFNSSSGGWTITNNATSTHTTTLTAASTFTLQSGKSLEVDGTFSNLTAGTEVWTGSTLYLTGGGSYTLNTKTSSSVSYGTLLIGAATNVRMWNSSASAVSVNAASGSLYSQNHANVKGSLFIWGHYTSPAGENWSYANDFDGTALGTSSRAVAVQIASSSVITLATGTSSITGIASATTTISNQGSGAYTFNVSGGGLNAQYYQIRNTDASGLNFSGSPYVASLANGDYQLAQATGASMMTVAASVINANPGLQIQNVRFATSTGVTSGFNVTEVGSPTSYWWFRNHYGNYAGEAHDNDPGPNSGNPGYIRWDDSNFLITISGHVYADHGTTPIGSPTCDGVTPNVTIVVQGGTTYTGACNASTGAYSISNVTFTGDVGILAYLNTNGGARAVTATKTATGDISNFDLYQNALIVRHEDIAPMTISDLAWYGSGNDSDIPYAAATSTMTLTTQPNTELYIWGGKTFTPGGTVTLQSGGSGDARDGRLYLAPSSTFTEAGTQALSIGGGLSVQSSATFTAANSSITFIATTTGKSIFSAAPLSLYNVTFNGAGGGWSLDSSAGIATTTVHALTLTSGTLSGTGDLVVQTGDLTGSGSVAMTGGTVRLESTGNFGNSNPWQFYNLTIGNSVAAATTTKTGSATTTVAGILTIASGSVLQTATTPWVLSGGGTPLVVNGTLQSSSAAFSYTATSSTNVTSGTFASLTLAPSNSGSPTYTLGGGSLIVNSLAVGDGTHAVTVTADTNDPSIGVSSLMTIHTGATFVASNVGLLDLSGSYANTGTFTHSGGSVLFDATGAGNTIAAGNSPFYDVTFSSPTGSWTLTGNATSTHTFTLTAASTFTLQSGKSLEVDGTFTNAVGHTHTTWTGSTLYLNGGSYTL
ncbi:MAG TPA: hypothetical protein VMU25_04165, partial [Candidatus Paceibacterota bacterium]|nr:hypothetical protein [Candidatus Paceibacterota bacterium]